MKQRDQQRFRTICLRPSFHLLAASYAHLGQTQGDGVDPRSLLSISLGEESQLGCSVRNVLRRDSNSPSVTVRSLDLPCDRGPSLDEEESVVGGDDQP